jgi:hypothetical protein
MMVGKWWVIKNILYTLIPFILFDMLDGIPDQTVVFALNILKDLL